MPCPARLGLAAPFIQCGQRHGLAAAAGARQGPFRKQLIAESLCSASTCHGACVVQAILFRCALPRISRGSSHAPTAPWPRSVTTVLAIGRGRMEDGGGGGLCVPAAAAIALCAELRLHCTDAACSRHGLALRVHQERENGAALRFARVCPPRTCRVMVEVGASRHSLLAPNS